MRIKVAIVLLCLVAVFVAFGLLLPVERPAPQQLTQIRTSCLACHSVDLRYGSVARLHELHSAVSCTQCHGPASLTLADTIHLDLEHIWIFLAGLSVAIIGANFFIVKVRTRKR